MNHYLKYRQLYTPGIFILVMLLSFSIISDISYSFLTTDNTSEKEFIFKPVIERLISEGADSAFVYTLVNHPTVKFEERFVKVNITTSMKKVDYSSHYSDKSASISRDFIKSNWDILTKCEEEIGIPREFITAIIWVETKFGTYLGKSHVPSVYLSTALAENPIYIETNIQANLNKFTGNKNDAAMMEDKIKTRSKKKADWALKELLALEKIYKQNILDIFGLYGSWAGAFGISQFLPSSFNNWAVDGNNDGRIDLFDTHDAIYSVANYLKSNGWGESEAQKKAAVFHYNNSTDYVEAIFKLAEKLTTPKFQKPLKSQVGSSDFNPE